MPRYVGFTRSEPPIRQLPWSFESTALDSCWLLDESTFFILYWIVLPWTRVHRKLFSSKVRFCRPTHNLRGVESTYAHTISISFEYEVPPYDMNITLWRWKFNLETRDIRLSWCVHGLHGAYSSPGLMRQVPRFSRLIQCVKYIIVFLIYKSATHHVSCHYSKQTLFGRASSVLV